MTESEAKKRAKSGNFSLRRWFFKLSLCRSLFFAFSLQAHCNSLQLSTAFNLKPALEMRIVGEPVKDPSAPLNCRHLLWTASNENQQIGSELEELKLSCGHTTMGGFISIFSFLILPSITLRSSKFRNHFTISSKYFDMACYLKWETYFGPISFEVLAKWHVNW